MQGASDELRVLLFLSSLCDIMLLHCPLSREHIWQDGTISYIMVNTATGKTCWIGLGQIIPCNCIPNVSLILVSYCDWYNSGFLLAPGLYHFFFLNYITIMPIVYENLIITIILQIVTFLFIYTWEDIIITTTFQLLYLNITLLLILYKCIMISLNILYYEIMQLNAI